MTIYDALFMSERLYKDEYGNAYFPRLCDSLRDSHYMYYLDCLKGLIQIDNDTFFLEKELYDKYSEYDIVVTADEESIDSFGYVRRPYFRMRGKPITKEQAFDIIRRTDNLFDLEMKSIRSHEDFISSINFNNFLFMKNHYPDGFGWIHADGTVGINGITSKYPEVEEFIYELFIYLREFPYLDLFIAFTKWDEVPPDAYDDNFDIKPFELEEFDDDFYDAIMFGIHVHDKSIKVINKRDARLKYKEYDRLYGSEREKFCARYYMDNKINQVDKEYLKRCIESYGLNADEELSKVPKYVLKGCY